MENIHRQIGAKLQGDRVASVFPRAEWPNVSYGEPRFHDAAHFAANP